MHAYDWTGFYVGGNVGGHWGSDKISTTSGTFDSDPAAGAAIDVASPVTLNPQGLIGGVQGGYNLEGSGGVFGIEVDASWLGGTASRSLSDIAGLGDTLTNSVQATFLSTLRMRWGTTVISDRSLLFITAGFAFETLKTADTIGHNGNSSFTSTSGSTTEPGLTAGAGFEYAITDNLSAKAEYLFIAIKDVNTTIPSTGTSDSIGVTHSYIDQVARVGLNLKLGG
jgi:outer membrane immunogenic protein